MRDEFDVITEPAGIVENLFDRCNFPGCRYAFKRKEALVDMADMRNHKSKHSVKDIVKWHQNQPLYKERFGDND